MEVQQFQQQLPAPQILQYLKKHPQSITISSEDFTMTAHGERRIHGEKSTRDFVIYNLVMKGQAVSQFEVANFRSGLALIQESGGVKEDGNLRVGRKGLRKIYELLPEYLQPKISISPNSKYCAQTKAKILHQLKLPVDSYTIYRSEKVDGINAQISWDQDGKFWILGAKNKTLILQSVGGIQYLIRKHQHVKSIAVAELWFKYLAEHADKIQRIKEMLSRWTLVGQFCDSERNCQIVDYGTNPKLYFYALVDKEERQFNCVPSSVFLEFVKQVGLEQHCVKFDINQVQTYEALTEELKILIKTTYEGELQKFGEGIVIYISTTKNGVQLCQSITKIKTLQYRFYHKLKQSLRQYFQKYRKSSSKILNRLLQQTKQIFKGIHLTKPQAYYINIAKKAFLYCQHQQKAINKYLNTRYINFIKMIQNDKITKENFKKIVYQDIGHHEIEKLGYEKQWEGGKGSENREDLGEERNRDGEFGGKSEEADSNQKMHKQLQIENYKKIVVMIPLTIPCSGKSTLFRKMKQNYKQFYIEILSSDSIRLQKMNQLMKKQKNLTKKESFEKSKVSAQKQFLRQIGQIVKKMSINKEFRNCILILDKNHPQNAFKGALQQIHKVKKSLKNTEIKVVCILHKSNSLIYHKSKFVYPFSSSYIASCIKRVIIRNQHETLEGTQLQRASICINFANMFRNFSLSSYHLSKYFDGMVTLAFTQQQIIPIQIEKQIMRILLGSKPGSFEQHEGLAGLIESLRGWQNEEINFDERMNEIEKILLEMFQKWGEMKIDTRDFENLN